MLKFIQDFQYDFSQLTRCMLDSNEPPFAFVRFGDGEAAILDGKPYQTKADGWRWPISEPGGRVSSVIETPGEYTSRDPEISWASEKIRTGLKAAVGYCPKDKHSARWYVGLPCPAHEPENHEIVSSWASEHLPLENQTFAKLFSDTNYRTWKFDVMPKLLTLPPGKRPILVGCRHNGKFFGDIEIPRDWMMTFCGDPDDMEVRRVASQIHDMAEPGQVVLIAAGPMAKIVILEYWISTASEPGGRAKIVDAGSAIDEWLNHRRTRVKTYDMMARHEWSESFGLNEANR